MSGRRYSRAMPRYDVERGMILCAFVKSTAHLVSNWPYASAGFLALSRGGSYLPKETSRCQMKRLGSQSLVAKPCRLNQQDRAPEVRSGFRIFLGCLDVAQQIDNLRGAGLDSQPRTGPSGRTTLNLIPAWITTSSPGRTIILR